MNSTEIREHIAQERANIDAIIASGDVSPKAGERHTAAKDRIAFLQAALAAAELREADAINAQQAQERAELGKWFAENCSMHMFLGAPIARLAKAYAEMVEAAQELEPAKDAWLAARREGVKRCQEFPGGAPHEVLNSSPEEAVATRVREAIDATVKGRALAAVGCLPYPIRNGMPQR
jgi:hypothetical protein